MAITAGKRADRIMRGNITLKEGSGFVRSIEKDNVITKAEAKALKKLSEADADKFENFPGVERWQGSRDHLENYSQTVALVMGKQLEVLDKPTGVSINMRPDLATFPVEMDMGDATAVASVLDISTRGAVASEAGELKFKYDDRTFRVKVRKGDTAENIAYKAITQLSRKYGGVEMAERVVDPMLAARPQRSASLVISFLV